MKMFVCLPQKNCCLLSEPRKGFCILGKPNVLMEIKLYLELKEDEEILKKEVLLNFQCKCLKKLNRQFVHKC